MATVQKVTEPNLKYERVEIGDSGNTKALSADFIANLTVFSSTSTLVVNTTRKSIKFVHLIV